MPIPSQRRVADALAVHTPKILQIHEEVNGVIRDRRAEYARLDPHQRKTRIAAERRAYVATGMRRMLANDPNWSLRRDLLDAGGYEWIFGPDLAFRLAKRLPDTPQPPALTTMSDTLFAHDATEIVLREQLLIRLLGNPLTGTASMDVACMYGRHQEWRMDLLDIARGTVLKTTLAPRQAEPVAQKPKTTITLPAQARRRNDEAK